MTLVLTVLALASPPALAQTRDPVAGEALFREGRRLLKAGEISNACAKLEESQRLDPAPGTLANLADCQEQLGHTATAWESWRRVAEQLPGTDPRRATAFARSTELEKKLSRLTIDLAPDLATSPPSGLTVKRDDVLLGQASFGLPLPLDPGAHTVVVTAPDRQTQTFDLVIAPGEQSRLRVTLGPRSLPAAAPMPAPAGSSPLELQGRLPGAPASPGPRRLVGYALLGAGVAALGGGLFFGLRALHARNDAKAGCATSEPGGPPPVCWSRARDALARDATDSRLADAGFVAGSVAAAVGAYLLITTGRNAQAPGHAAATGVRDFAWFATPLVAPGHNGAATAGGEVSFAGKF